MSPVGDNIPNAGSAAPHRGIRQRVLQKLKPASGLHGDPDGFAKPDGQNCRKSGPKPLSRSGTGGAVPFRHSPQAPRLAAAFVAQLLGQLMPGERIQPTACAVYDGAPHPNPVFDRKL